MYIQTAYPWIIYGKTIITEVIELNHPEIPLSFDSILAFKNSLFVFELKDFEANENGVVPTHDPNNITENEMEPKKKQRTVRVKGDFVYNV